MYKQPLVAPVHGCMWGPNGCQICNPEPPKRNDSEKITHDMLQQALDNFENYGASKEHIEKHFHRISKSWGKAEIVSSDPDGNNITPLD